MTSASIKLLDLFCGAGGASAGYRLDGDRKTSLGWTSGRKKRYPFDFVQADALEFLRDHGNEFDAVHASPPCQAFVNLARVKWQKGGKVHRDLLAPTIEALAQLCKPHIVENVMTAPVGATLILCGSHFGLQVQRHRKFRCSFLIPQPACRHVWDTHNGRPIGVYGSAGITQLNFAVNRFRNMAEARRAMGIDWMTRAEITQAIPPSYTEYIGRHLVRHLQEIKREAA